MTQSTVTTTGWSDKIVALEKTTWFHFRLMKTGFLFFLLQTIYELASCVQIPRAIGAIYHVWKWHNVQCARSEMHSCTTHASTVPSYNNRTIASTLKMQIWIATNNKDVLRLMKTKFPATVMIFSVVSSEGHIMPPHIFEVGMKVNTKVYLDVLKSVVIIWCNQVAGGRPWMWQQGSTPAHKSKETEAWHQEECYDFVHFSHEAVIEVEGGYFE